MYGKALSTVNGRERRWRPASSLPHRMASSLLEPSSQNLMNSSENLPKSDLTSASHFPRSKLLYIPEEYSHWPSLMARDFSLGPSDAPWPVETSTAHGDSSSWESNLSMGKFNPPGGTVSTSSNNHSRILLNQSSQKMDSPPEASPPASSRRRFPHLTWPTKLFLGFWLEGLTLSRGPLTSLKPKSIRYDLSHNFKNSRSDPITLLLSLNKCMCRFLFLAGRRLQKRKKPCSLLWRCNISLRTLVLTASMVIVSDSNSLKLYNLLFSIPICRSVDYCFESSTPNYHPTTLLSSTFKHRPRYITSKICNQCSQEDSDGHRRDHDFLLCTSLQSSPDYSKKLLRVYLLVPARSTIWSHLSTSLSLLTVTILSSTDSFVEDLSTNRDLTCDRMLYSFCLKALMDSMSICFIYHFMVLGNASFSHVFILAIFESFILVLVT